MDKQVKAFLDAVEAGKPCVAITSGLLDSLAKAVGQLNPSVSGQIRSMGSAVIPLSMAKELISGIVQGQQGTVVECECDGLGCEDVTEPDTTDPVDGPRGTGGDI